MVFRILDELVEPMRDLQLDDTEYGCLKTLLFFNPSSLLCLNNKSVTCVNIVVLRFYGFVGQAKSERNKAKFLRGL